LGEANPHWHRPAAYGRGDQLEDLMLDRALRWVRLSLLAGIVAIASRVGGRLVEKGSRGTSFRYRTRLAAVAATVVLAGPLSVVLVQPASANPINPGSSDVTPDVYTTSPGTALATEGDTFTVKNISYSIWAYQAAVGEGLCNGCLNYIVTVHTDPGATVTQIALSGFGSGGQLDAGYNTELGYGQAGAPEYVGETANGTVTFTYASALSSQETTDYLEVETSTKTYDNNGTVCMYNSVGSLIQCGTGYEPTPAPEPASVALFGTALAWLGLFGAVRRRHAGVGALTPTPERRAAARFDVEAAPFSLPSAQTTQA
jgi:hypothetical protein